MPETAFPRFVGEMQGRGPVRRTQGRRSAWPGIDFQCLALPLQPDSHVCAQSETT